MRRDVAMRDVATRDAAIAIRTMVYILFIPRFVCKVKFPIDQIDQIYG